MSFNIRSPKWLKCIGKSIKIIFFDFERWSTNQHLSCVMGWPTAMILTICWVVSNKSVNFFRLLNISLSYRVPVKSKLINVKYWELHWYLKWLTKKLWRTKLMAVSKPETLWYKVAFSCKEIPPIVFFIIFFFGEHFICSPTQRWSSPGPTTPKGA